MRFLETSAKDRSFILKLERNMLTCLRAAGIDRIKLNTALQNYERMLVHRCADYYGFEREVAGVGCCAWLLV